MQMLRCERFHCTLSTRACVLRQQDRWLKGGCIGCEQGEKIMQGTKKCAKCGLRKPVEEFYGTDTACKECRKEKINEARRLVKVRKKAEQAAQAPAETAPETARKCVRCGETKPLAEFYKLKSGVNGHDTSCKICRCKLQREADQRRKHATQAPEETKAAEVAPVVEEPKPEAQQPQAFAIMIDFSEFPGVLDSLEQQARSEIRSIEGQALWILKDAMDLRSVRRSIALETAN